MGLGGGPVPSIISDSHWFRLRVRVLSADGSEQLEADQQCKTPDLRRLVKRVVKDLDAKGAKELLMDAKSF